MTTTEESLMSYVDHRRKMLNCYRIVLGLPELSDAEMPADEILRTSVRAKYVLETAYAEHLKQEANGWYKPYRYHSAARICDMNQDRKDLYVYKKRREASSFIPLAWRKRFY